MIFETFRQAIQNVWSNKLRTFLTMLGIIIGVMAVIVIVGLGNGMTKSMRDSFSAMGTNTLSVSIWGYGSRTASVEDVYKIADKNKELISAVSPQIDFSNNTPKVGTTTYRYGTSVYGVDEHYAEMKNYTLAQGRGLQYMDIKDNKQVCIIGDYLNRAAYGGNAVGQTIKLGAYKFRIVGVLNAKVTDKNMQQGSDDDCIYLPYTTAMRLSNESSPDSYSAIMVDESQANEAKAAVEQGLYDIFKSDSAYYVYSASEWLEEMNKMINMVIVILTGIASISLLVGGIGIMNIMLVSVTERTREIGIRKAMGAKERTILAQFVTEAATTSALGGTLGIILGYIVSAIANQVLPMFTDGMDVTVSPSFNSIAVAFGISVGIGVGATLLSLILPLFRRYSDEVNQVRSKLESRQVTLDYCRTMMAGYRREQFYVICLTADGSIICNRKVTEGTLSAVTAYPRLVLEAALNSNAHSVVLCHNHPGGVALPSEDDVCTTRYLQQLMEGVGIIVLDHVIVAGNQTYSMAQHGELLHPSEIMRAMVAAAEKPLRK